MKSWEPIPARCYGPQDRGLKSAWSNVRLACNAFAIWPGGILAWIKKLPLGCGDIQLLSLGPNTTLDSICFHVPNVNNLANVDSSSGLLKPGVPTPSNRTTYPNAWDDRSLIQWTVSWVGLRSRSVWEKHAKDSYSVSGTILRRKFDIPTLQHLVSHSMVIFVHGKKNQIPRGLFIKLDLFKRKKSGNKINCKCNESLNS